MPSRRCQAIPLVLVSLSALVSGCGGRVITSAEVPVPEVVGLSGERAIALICRAGIVPARPSAPEPSPVPEGAGWTTYEPCIPENRPIADARPGPGTPVARGASIKLWYVEPYTDKRMQLEETCP